ncbi:MAG: hypothetical protein EAZ93_15320 [Oscillatoriales cyanobacterium]|nr:MAG: hypothetical protein EAZ93_15320 [Oscillatoriales cyanobacterium]
MLYFILSLLSKTLKQNFISDDFDNLSLVGDQEFLDGTRHVIYPWNQSQIENLKSSLPPNLSVKSIDTYNAP